MHGAYGYGYHNKAVRRKATSIRRMISVSGPGPGRRMLPSEILYSTLSTKVGGTWGFSVRTPYKKPFRDDILHIGETLVAIATKTEQTAQRFSV